MKREIETAPLVDVAAHLGALLVRRQWRVTLAESCTGGQIAAALTASAGASQFFDASYVTYSNAAKSRDLAVPEHLLVEHGAVSGPVVGAMAAGALQRAGADLALAVSGIAGPGGGGPDKPVGTVWLAVATAAHTRTWRLQLPGDRTAVQRAAVRAALLALIEAADDRAGAAPTQS